MNKICILVILLEKLKIPTFNCADKIIVIFYVNICKNIHRLRFYKLLLSLSPSASAFAPSSLILFFTKIIIKSKNNRLFIAIINKNRIFVWTLKLIIQMNIKT